jgi:hypothetical protein
MKLSDDLSPRWIWIKAILFLLILLGASALVIFTDERLQRLLYLLCVIWSSARLYYFLFYVMEKYVDPSFRFSGLGNLVRYLFRQKK